MTLKEIKSMFKVGQSVLVTREGNTPLLIVGNAGNTTLPANNGTEARTIDAVKSQKWVMKKQDGRNVNTPYPKASEILEARPGYVKFRYDTNNTIVTIEAHAN